MILAPKRGIDILGNKFTQQYNVPFSLGTSGRMAGSVAEPLVHHIGTEFIKWYTRTFIHGNASIKARNRRFTGYPVQQRVGSNYYVSQRYHKSKLRYYKHRRKKWFKNYKNYSRNRYYSNG